MRMLYHRIEDLLMKRNRPDLLFLAEETFVERIFHIVNRMLCNPQINKKQIRNQIGLIIDDISKLKHIHSFKAKLKITLMKLANLFLIKIVIKDKG